MARSTTGTVLACALVASLLLPATAFAMNGPSQQAGAPEQVQGEQSGDSQQEQTQQRQGTQECAQTRSQGDGEMCDEGDQPKTRERVRAEKREGDYPEEVPGEGDRERDRERATEETESVESSASVELEDAALSEQGEAAVGPTDSAAGFTARVRAWVHGVLAALGIVG